ncbi:MAG: hypothetical protein IPM32_18245 [Ignavibacteriae bacterium]|nr:hypothetical protein [Ignavibacteriota bacterium]
MDNAKKYCELCSDEITEVLKNDNSTVQVDMDYLTKTEMRNINKGQQIIFDEKLHVSHENVCRVASYRKNVFTMLGIGPNDWRGN